MTMRKLACALFGCLALAACESYGPSCADAPTLLPTAGSTVVANGELITGATAQRITISADRRFLEHVFTRNGVTMTARYALEAPQEIDPAP
jgi:hypothetical protein